VRIRVKQVIAASIEQVWEELADLSRHAEWMADATAIEFTGPQRRGVGTRFECPTRVGPFRTRDRMTVTGWEEGRSISVRHEGLVTGEGRLSVRRSARAPRSRSVVTWREELRFPWYFGGPAGALAAKPVLRRLWRGNLRRLRARLEA
jgi:carbon monoxide dehydrogenase subunit G